MVVKFVKYMFCNINGSGNPVKRHDIGIFENQVNSIFVQET